MNEQWRFQLRLTLPDGLAEAARTDPTGQALAPLADVLARHHATLLSQFDAFARYVNEAEAHGPDRYPLYRWTRATLEDPEKRAKHRRIFALHVGGQDVYNGTTADGLEADLQPLLALGLIERLSRHDTNPANNLPVPEQYRS